jgi:hypothetical protein
MFKLLNWSNNHLLSVLIYQNCKKNDHYLWPPWSEWHGGRDSHEHDPINFGLTFCVSICRKPTSYMTSISIVWYFKSGRKGHKRERRPERFTPTNLQCRRSVTGWGSHLVVAYIKDKDVLTNVFLRPRCLKLGRLQHRLPYKNAQLLPSSKMEWEDCSFSRDNIFHETNLWTLQE